MISHITTVGISAHLRFTTRMCYVNSLLTFDNIIIGEDQDDIYALTINPRFSACHQSSRKISRNISKNVLKSGIDIKQKLQSNIYNLKHKKKYADIIQNDNSNIIPETVSKYVQNKATIHQTK